MPLIDCDDYSLPALNIGAAQGLQEEIRLAGQDPDLQPVSFLNIYFGVQDLQTQENSPWHICVPRPYGFLCVVFHSVRHGDVHRTNVSELADSLGLCITLLWTSERPTDVEVLDALQVADEMIQNIELIKGRPLPLPLRPAQLPDRIAVRTIDPTKQSEHSVSTTVMIADVKTSLIADPDLALKVGALSGALGSTDKFINSPIASALHHSSLWQRQAIRALGIHEWSDAIVASNVWLETFMVQLAVILNETNETPIDDVSSEVMRSGLARFVVRNLGSNFLKGKWDGSDEVTEFGRWHQRCHKLRNSIVHAGHFATEIEANTAYDAAHKLAHHITRAAAGIKDKRLRQSIEPLIFMANTKKQR